MHVRRYAISILVVGLAGCGQPTLDGSGGDEATGAAEAAITGSAYRLPWSCNVTLTTTQGNHGDICGGGVGDHTGVQAYAWDFGLPRDTQVRASRGGTVTVAAEVVGPGQSCYDGCVPFTSACCSYCLNRSNHVNIAHGDGTVATYWHLDRVTVSVGQRVNQGDVIGLSGTSGCSTGPHLHFQVMGNCPTGYCQSVPIGFAEAGTPACGNRVTSANACGGGGGGGGSGGQCFSATLAKNVAPGTCVQAASDGNFYTCASGAWQAGEHGCTATFPWCNSATLGHAVPPRACVQSKFDRVWYQCNEGGAWTTPVANGAGPLGVCSQMHAL